MKESIIVEMLAGSRVYGTHTPSSDEDFRGVCLAPPEIKFSVFKNMEQVEEKGRDRILYELKKFLKLSADCNPNIIEQWFTPEQFYIRKTPLWDKLMENRHLFISKKCKWTFSGYAHSQLLKLKSHHKWLREKPKKPTRKEFNLPEKHLLNQSQCRALVQLPSEWARKEYMDYAKNFKRYAEALKDYNAYENHLRNRNTDRLELEKKFGYDLKHAYHLIRLFHEGVELLSTGKITLPRPEKELLLEIRQGEYSLDTVIEMADTLEDQMDNLYETSTLQHKPQLNKIDKLYQEIIADPRYLSG